MHGDMRKDGLRLIILDILANENCHGYGISDRIEKLYGIKRPSPGLVYPLLSSMQKRGLVKVTERGKRDKKIYAITDRGREYLEARTDELRKVKKILNNLGYFYGMGGEELMSSIKELIKNLDKVDENKREDIAAAMEKLINAIHEALELRKNGK